VKQETIQHYVEQWSNYSIKANEAFKNSRTEEGNRNMKDLHSLSVEIIKNPEAFKQVTHLLMMFPEPYVRVSAAIYAHKNEVNKIKAVETLREAAKNTDYGRAFIEASLYISRLDRMLRKKEKTMGDGTYKINAGSESIGIIQKHIEAYLGEIDSVFHELVSDALHIDIFYIKPNAKRNVHTFVTCGMSNVAMATPKGCESQQYCELMISIPSDWKINHDFMHENNWPLKVLKQLARIPYEQNTWIGYGHTIQNGNPAVPYPGNSELSNMLVAYPISVPNVGKFMKLNLDDNRTIHFYSLIPITNDEADLIKKSGIDAIFDYFDRYKLKDVFLNHRKSLLVAKRKIRVLKMKLIMAFFAGFIVLSLMSGFFFALSMSSVENFNWDLVQYGILVCSGLTSILLVAFLLSKNRSSAFVNKLFTKYLVDPSSKETNDKIGSPSESLTHWITDILENSVIENDIVALNIGFFESEDGIMVYCTGSKTYSELDSDWAGDIDFIPTHKYFTPEETLRKLDLLTFSSTMNDSIRNILLTNVSKIPNSISHITCGFDDGDLSVVWSRNS